MPVVKIHRDEMEIVKEAASRVERRSNSRFVIDQTKLEVTDSEREPAAEADDEDSKPPAIFD
jgi:hypothetical protein